MNVDVLVGRSLMKLIDVAFAFGSSMTATDLNVVTLNPTAPRGSNEASDRPPRLAGKTKSSVLAVHPGGTSKIPNGDSNRDFGGPWLLPIGQENTAS